MAGPEPLAPVLHPAAPQATTPSPAPAATGTPNPRTLRPSLAMARLDLSTVELVASRFLSFREVGDFHQAIAALAGTESVQVRRLQRGALQVRVQCRSVDELLAGLAASYGIPFRLIAREPHRVEIVFEPAATAPDPVLVERGA